jgi:hypothetical protein
MRIRLDSDDYGVWSISVASEKQGTAALYALTSGHSTSESSCRLYALHVFMRED